MTEKFLLNSPTAERLYHEYAENLTIIDYHNHISAADVASNKRFRSITEMWVSADPYKHRLMRISGIPEHFITGDASDLEKFEKFASVFPYLGGTPVYEWSLLELRRMFGIDDMPSRDNAIYLYDKMNEMLSSPEFRTQGLLSRFGVEYQSPVASLTDTLDGFDGVNIAPSLRGDNLLLSSAELISQLERQAASRITDINEYISAVDKRIGEFCSKGCRFADHALDDGFSYIPDDGENGDRFKRSLASPLTGEDKNALASELLRRLAPIYARRDMTLLLHMGAKRETSDRLRALAGPVGGYAAIGRTPTPTDVTNMLGDFERLGGLPKALLFPLNMSDMPALAALGGSFSEDGVGGKIQLGPAWWWCDHPYGIRSALEAQSSFGILAEFIGMTTDSRSILSFARHEYFRRIFCSYLAELAEAGRAPDDIGILSEIVRRVCYSNAKKRI